jgi:UDP-glucose 4-epimerase
MKTCDPLPSRNYFIAGGAGFIGSHFVDALLCNLSVEQVTIYDNFSSGRRWHFAHHVDDDRFEVIEGDVSDRGRLRVSMKGHDTVVHLASNPDIARAATDPTVDFVDGTVLTQEILEAMRLTSARRILYASGSGVYGDLGVVAAKEDRGPLMPISTYGASKLAGESLISAYCHMFGLTGCAFRFGNVVGARQTHGVGLDFLSRLKHDSTRLRILGDGRQSKSYVHVTDIIAAVLLASEKQVNGFDVYNVATGSYITVAEIADLAAECLNIPGEALRYEYTGGDRGWKGDVPVVRLNADKMLSLGWRCQYTSRQAVFKSLRELLPTVDAAIS